MPSAYNVPMASDVLPDPDTPTTATVRHSGTSTSMSCRLLCRAARTPMTVGRVPGTGTSAAVIPGNLRPSASGCCLGVKGAVEVKRGADQRQVGQCLGEVPLLRSGAADLLGVQAEVVAVGEHLLERQPRLVQAPGAGERLDVPERACREGAFGAAQPVRAGLRVVAVDEGIGYQAGGKRVEGGQPLGVGR